MPLDTSQQTNAYREQVRQEQKIASSKTHGDFDRMTKHMSSKLNFFEMYRQDEHKNNDGAVSYSHPLDSIVSTNYDFNPKSKKDRSYNPANRPSPKSTQKYPATSSQVYGWHAPIDTFPSAAGLKSELGIYGDIYKRKPEKKA
jgi:hypothetical protein